MAVAVALTQDELLEACDFGVERKKFWDNGPIGHIPLSEQYTRTLMVDGPGACRAVAKYVGCAWDMWLASVVHNKDSQIAPVFVADPKKLMGIPKDQYAAHCYYVYVVGAMPRYSIIGFVYGEEVPGIADQQTLEEREYYCFPKEKLTGMKTFKARVKEVLAKFRPVLPNISRIPDRDAVRVAKVKCVKETPKSLLVHPSDESHEGSLRTFYMPKSQILPGSDLAKVGDEGVLIMPSWLAKKKGLLEEA